MRRIQYLLAAILSFSLISTAFAVPPRPWLAVAEGHQLFSSNSACVRAGTRVLNQQGFARVSSTGSTVMGAYRSGSDYRFKVAIKCLSSSRSAVAFVTTTESGQGLNKAQSLINGLHAQARASYAPAAEPEYEEEYEEEVLEEEVLEESDFEAVPLPSEVEDEQ